MDMCAILYITLLSDVSGRSIAISAAAKQTPLAILMPDMKVYFKDKINPVFRQALQHESVWGERRRTYRSFQARLIL
jgi:hypothetical protein